MFSVISSSPYDLFNYCLVILDKSFQILTGFNSVSHLLARSDSAQVDCPKSSLRSSKLSTIGCNNFIVSMSIFRFLVATAAQKA
jgi:hypothetical protein